MKMLLLNVGGDSGPGRRTCDISAIGTPNRFKDCRGQKVGKNGGRRGVAHYRGEKKEKKTIRLPTDSRNEPNGSNITADGIQNQQKKGHICKWERKRKIA